jgi:hypothetical protein
MALTRTLAEAEEGLATWKAALAAIATGTSYTIGDRQLTRADEEFVVRMIDRYDAEVDRQTAGRGKGARVMRIIPRPY